MIKRSLLICLSSLLFVALIPLSLTASRHEPPSDLKVRNGVMDLSSWDVKRDPRISLDGEWEFYWRQLLAPADFLAAGAEAASTPKADYMKVPGQWNGKTPDGRTLPAFGYATYRMVLKNVPPDGVFALKKTNIRFSSTIFVNGRKLFEDGKPSAVAADYRPGNIPQFELFSADARNVEIIIQVANYDYINAGIPASLYFGEQAAMMMHEKKDAMREFSMLAILGTIALIYLICFAATALYRMMDYSLLVFAAFCLLFATYHGLIGERSLSLFLPAIPFETLYRTKDIVSVASLIVLILFFHKLQSNIIPVRWMQAASSVLGAFLVLAAILPIRDYTVIQTYVIVLYQALLFWMLLRVAIFYVKGAETNRVKGLLLFMAILMTNLYSLDIILFAMSWTEDLWLAQLYMILFNIVMILLVVLRFFEAYHTVDEMKNRLLRADKIKDDFLSNTSHELKTPLHAIVNISDSLLKGVEGPVTERQRENLTVIMDSGRRLAHLVNELIDYSQMKHGDIALRKSGIHLRKAIDSVLRMHAYLLGGKPIALVNAIGEEVPAVYADGNRLIQILHNLIGNAVKFTDRGEVSVSAKALPDRVEVRVSDTGIGMAATVLERIFEPFEQADTSATRSYEGTGLGLSISKRLVELHGGEIRVESRPGHGSVFTFSLPRSGAAAIGIAEQAATAEEPLARAVPVSAAGYPVYAKGKLKERLLLVDDDPAGLRTMTNLLRLEGYPVTAVNSGRMALDELAREPDFFLVVLDIMMPGMSGYEVLLKIRERFSSFELPVLMLTARRRATDVRAAMEAGANDFVDKPFAAEELLARVSSLTRLKASVKQAANAEIAFLRSQIKPHFLYNALNAIATLCIDDPSKAEELTLHLSEYLRGSFEFKNLDSLSTLHSELELVDAYVLIEQARFGDRLQVEYDIDADPDLMIPPLILQPLVENAIRHGLMANLEGGKVSIAVKEEADNRVRFRVADNGCGMSERRQREAMSPDPDQRGVGLWNIGRRLKLLYDTSLRLESAEGRGTTVSFAIPAHPAENGKENEPC